MWQRYYKTFLHMSCLRLRDVIDMNKFSRFQFDPYEDDELDVGLDAVQRRISMGGAMEGAGVSTKAGGQGSEEVKAEEDIIATVANTPAPLPACNVRRASWGKLYVAGANVLEEQEKTSEVNLVYSNFCA